MKRNAPLKRTAFRRAEPPARPKPVLKPIRQLRVDDGKARASVPIPKPTGLRNEGYVRLVASFECIHCGRQGRSQAAHADQGKGMGTKASDSTAYPACADEPGRIGCHTLIGSTGAYTREQRRNLEQLYADRTRQRVIAAGRWPKVWPFPSRNLL